MIMKSKTALTPRNFMELVTPTNNIYETTVIIARRAKQIAFKTKEELNNQLAEFGSAIYMEEGVENKEHIEISKLYEKRPKPVTIATEEFLADKIMYRYPDVEASPEA